jgi:hypothetical protein
MRRYFALLVLLLAIGCSGPEGPQLPPEPDDLIEQEKLVQVLADVHLLEAALGMRSPVMAPRPLRPGEINNPKQPVTPIAVPLPGSGKSLAYYDIFKQHGVTWKQYESSMTWYAAQPDVLDEIYEKVVEELSARQTRDAVGK